QSKLDDLGRWRAAHLQQIDRIDGKLDEFAGRNPVTRWRARDTIENLAEQRAGHVEQLAGIDRNIAGLHEQIYQRENGLAGRANNDRALQAAQARAATRNPQIDRALEHDLQRRAERIATQPTDQQADYGIGPIPKTGSERERWLDRAARIDQHHTGWDGHEHVRDPAENRLRRSLEQSLERQIRPPQQQERDRGIDRGFGISL
ncbi:MAG: hypothetical protein AB7Q27_08280, partial [Acidimicrobiia bacterium]